MRYFLAICLFTVAHLHGIVLETIDEKETLSGKKIGYFVGSFDPPTHAHIAIVEKALEHLDFVIVHPVWGGDPYKKRTDVLIRNEMLFCLFEKHPKVIVSSYNPKTLQDSLKDLPATFVGILGTDTLRYLAPNPETAKVYMTGLPITEEYANHTWGSCMAIKVDSFLLALRENDPPVAALDTRPIIAILELGTVKSLSSTSLKSALTQHQSLDSYTPKEIIAIIQKYNLYK